jgi:putative DNA primase/helicase
VFGLMSSAADVARALRAKGRGPRWVAHCPAHEDGRESLSITTGRNGQVLLHCFAGCGFTDIVSMPILRELLDDDWHNETTRRRTPRPAKPQPPDDSAFWKAIWRETVDSIGSPAEVYLLGRLGRLECDLTDLRYHPRCPRGQERLPALVALMRDAVTNEPTGIHRTFIKPDGNGKTDLQPARMMLGRSIGSVVKLSCDEDVTLGLGLSEGIEDGLAIINAGWGPVWACLSAHGMAAIPLLRGIEALTAFCDADSPGRKAAAAVVQRWHEAGLEAVIAEPPVGVKDFGELGHG